MCGKNVKIIGFSSPDNSFKKIIDECKLTSKNNGLFDIYDFKRWSTEEVSKQFKDLVIKEVVVATPKI